MARKKKEESGGGGAPAWMAPFSDLMNLLLCFFVLLFAFSSVDVGKFEAIVASLQNSFSILPAGGSSVGDGDAIGAGINQLKELDTFYRDGSNSNSQTGQENPEQDVKEEYEKQSLGESEEMAEQMEAQAGQLGIGDKVEIEAHSDYVLLTLGG